MWISIIHLNFNILVVFDAIIMVYAVSANISVQILLVRKFMAWKLKPRKCRVPFKIQMNIHKSITVFASLWCLVLFIHPKLEGYKLRHDTSREQWNEELGRLSYKMIVKLLDILGLQSLFERWEKIPLGVMYKTSSENRTFRCKLHQEPWSNCTLQPEYMEHTEVTEVSVSLIFHQLWGPTSNAITCRSLHWNRIEICVGEMLFREKKLIEEIVCPNLSGGCFHKSWLSWPTSSNSKATR